jgi:membrane-bound metal-dependent hydrolase YbcI (DUF457 family)
VPVGPLHLGFTLPVFARFKARLELLPLALGSFIPDIELLLMWPFMGRLEAARGPMHSLLGAVTIDLIFSLLYVYLVAPPLIAWFVGRVKEPKTAFFAGADISQKPSRLTTAVFSGLIGTVSHVLIDLFSHTRNPLFWPCSMGEGLNLMPFDKLPSSISMHARAAVLLFFVARKYWRR